MQRFAHVHLLLSGVFGKMQNDIVTNSARNSPNRHENRREFNGKYRGCEFLIHSTPFSLKDASPERILLKYRGQTYSRKTHDISSLSYIQHPAQFRGSHYIVNHLLPILSGSALS